MTRHPTSIRRRRQSKLTAMIASSDVFARIFRHFSAFRSVFRFARVFSFRLRLVLFPFLPEFFPFHFVRFFPLFVSLGSAAECVRLAATKILFGAMACDAGSYFAMYIAAILFYLVDDYGFVFSSSLRRHERPFSSDRSEEKNWKGTGAIDFKSLFLSPLSPLSIPLPLLSGGSPWSEDEAERGDGGARLRGRGTGNAAPSLPRQRSGCRR